MSYGAHYANGGRAYNYGGRNFNHGGREFNHEGREFNHRGYYYGAGFYPGYYNSFGYGRGFGYGYEGPGYYNSYYNSPAYISPSYDYLDPGYAPYLSPSYNYVEPAVDSANSSPSYDYVDPIQPAAPSAPLNNTAEVDVSLPRADAQVWVNGNRMSSNSSTRRSFVSPALEPGYSYSYRVSATWMENGREVRAERTVPVSAGQVSTVDFSSVRGTPAIAE